MDSANSNSAASPDQFLFRAKTTKELPPEAQDLVDAYDATPGSTGPGANPASIAAVLTKLVAKHTTCHGSMPEPVVRVKEILTLIQQLR